jgi:hypothetical protein
MSILFSLCGEPTSAVCHSSPAPRGTAARLQTQTETGTPSGETEPHLSKYINKLLNIKITTLRPQNVNTMLRPQTQNDGRYWETIERRSLHLYTISVPTMKKS